MAEAVAPVSFTASATVAKTGLSKCVSPAFFGFVPPTTLVPFVVLVGTRFGRVKGSVPYSIACRAWKLVPFSYWETSTLSL